MKTVLILLISIFVLSCADRDRNGNVLDTPTNGHIVIATDESLKPLIDAELTAFQGIYQNAHVDVKYTSEQEAIDLLLKDSVRLVVVSRKLFEEEKEIIASQKIVPTEMKMATGGIALIAHPSTSDTIIHLNDLKELLTGIDVTRFSEVVFDEPKSGIIRHLSDLFKLDKQPGSNCFALSNSQAVVQYVAQKPGTLGLIDLSWISDRDDSTANAFLDSIKVMAVGSDTAAYQPYQAYIAQHKYELSRDIVVISREARSGLGSGLIAFIASDKGQRIVLKSGLVPATMPIRIIEVNHQPF